MSIIKSVCNIVLESLFPISPAEQEMLSMSPGQAWKELPRARNFSTKEACSIFSYKDERMRQLVWNLKYKKSAHAAQIGGYALHSILNLYSNAAGGVVAVPMPITKQRRRERGFNQCELLANEITRIDQNMNVKVVNDLLIRTRHKSRQTLKTRNERLESAKELFAVSEKALLILKESGDERTLEDRLVIVIDDVITTGSTMREAINALREAGFKKTYGLSLAH